MGGKLKPNERKQLETWIGGRKKFILLYSASGDGCSAATFHQKCNNQGPTVTVLYNTNQTTFGGYTANSWNSGNIRRTTYYVDANAFLFRLQYNGASKPAKFPRNGNGNDVYCSNDYGPTFGGGHDLLTFTGNINHNGTFYTFRRNINNNGTYYQLNGSISPGYSYNFQGEDADSFANGSLQVTDIEVYQVCDDEGYVPVVIPLILSFFVPFITTTGYNISRIQKIDDTTERSSDDPKDIENPGMEFRESSSDDPKDIPWRRTPEWSTGLMHELKEYVENYKPLRALKIQQAKILLVGQIGSGKSSFFNTINSLFRGYVTSQACSGNSEHSLTTQYRMYQVRNGGSGKPLNFRLCDTRGLEEDQGLDTVEMSHLLDGNVPDHYLFNPSSPISSDVPGFISSPKLGDKIHCVAFVVDASTVDVVPEKVVERMKTLQARMNKKGVPQVVLMTKIDKICQPLSGDLSKVFHIPTIEEHVEKVAQVMGLPRAHVLPVKNYESEMELDENINILSLFAMQKMLHFANDFLYNFLDEIEADQLNQMSIKE